MTKESKYLDTSAESNKRALFTPHGITLITMWLLTSVLLILMLFNGIRNTDQFQIERYILQIAYVAALIWYIIGTGKSAKQLPDLNPLLLPKLRIGKIIPVIIIVLLFVAELFGQGIVLPLLMIATIWILIAWHRDIGLLQIYLGLAVALIAFLGGLPFWDNQFIGKVVFIGLLINVMPMFIAGGLLSKRTGLGGSKLFAGYYSKGLLSFLYGCLLFVPLGLLNAATGSPGTGITWVTHWWMPFSLPWFSGIAEEIWYRLIMVTLCYFMLRPAFSKKPRIAVVFSILFSAIIFGLGHSGSFMEKLLTTGMLYGLPMAVIYAKRDWEHAVGAHYMINFIPWIMVFWKM